VRSYIDKRSYFFKIILLCAKSWLCIIFVIPRLINAYGGVNNYFQEGINNHLWYNECCKVFIDTLIWVCQSREVLKITLKWYFNIIFSVICYARHVVFWVFQILNYVLLPNHCKANTWQFYLPTHNFFQYVFSNVSLFQQRNYSPVFQRKIFPN
jgi:hypothetical protein